MPEDYVCLRVVDFKRWADPRPTGVASDDAPAWCLKNLSPNAGDNALSMFLIPAHLSEEIAPLVAAALTATQDKISHAEFILFDSAYLAGAGLTVRRLPGNTPHREVNKLHVDVDVTSNRVAALASVIYGKAEPRRVLDKDVTAKLVELKRAGQLDLERIRSAKIREALEAA